MTRAFATFVFFGLQASGFFAFAQAPVPAATDAAEPSPALLLPSPPVTPSPSSAPSLPVINSPSPSAKPAASPAALSPKPSTSPLPPTPTPLTKAEKEEKEFREKLNISLKKSEESIRLLRNQITESQNAPFIADLYLQLAELLSQKSNTLYYIQMELQKDKENIGAKDKEFSPVIQAQQEATGIYRLILKDFPDYPKRLEIMYRLTVALKAIDETTEFIKTAQSLINEFPQADEAMRARLLLAQHFFERQAFPEALDLLKPVTLCSLTYERNLARYRVGLIYLVSEKQADSLKEFEAVISDPKLTAEMDPYDISFKSRGKKIDLRREALIDSLRAYTTVYAENPDPLPYYLKLAPNELYFQEIIEKLALRYINLKKFQLALKLLRALSERIAEPQKIITIYQEVLIQIPIEQRAQIPAIEMKFVLDKYNSWVSYYKVKPEVKANAHSFFEKQIRELGTSSHAYSKAAKTPELKKQWLERARDFYDLYLTYFLKNPNATKIAIDQADVYFSLEQYLLSGDLYLKIFKGEFGEPPDKKILIENAILCFQKKGTYSYYENMRLKGLLIKAIEAYIAFDKKLRDDPKINLLLVKTVYEQGFFPEALNTIFNFVQRFKSFPQSIDAAELILDYFNTKSDYEQLKYWADRLLALQLQNPDFNKKLTDIKTAAKAKLVKEKIRSVSGFDEFQQGKSYLVAAASSQDSALAGEALKEALAQARKERDIETFIAAANMMAEKEPNAAKKLEIRRSVAHEYVKMTRYYAGLNLLGTLLDKSTDPKVRLSLLEEAADLALTLRDFELLQKYWTHPAAAGFSQKLKQRTKELLTDFVESPNPISSAVAAVLLAVDSGNEVMLSLYKAQDRLDTSSKARIMGDVQARCLRDTRAALCAWIRLEQADNQRDAFLATVNKTATTLDLVETISQQFQSLNTAYQSLEGSGDPHLETVLSLRGAQIFDIFATYLAKVADANPDVKTVLMQKANETKNSSKSYRDRCKMIQTKTTVIHPASKLCGSDRNPEVKQIISWPQEAGTPLEGRTDLATGKYEELQKKLVFSEKNASALYEIAREYYYGGQVSHAFAASTYGLSLYKEKEDEFNLLLGCLAADQGLFNEAQFRLQHSSSTDGLKEKCMSKIAGKKS